MDELPPNEHAQLCPDWADVTDGAAEETAASRAMETPAADAPLAVSDRVQEIKAMIDALSPMEQCELNALVQDWPDDEWDKQMRADCAPGGKLHKLMLEAEEDAKAGRLRDWPEPPGE